MRVSLGALGVSLVGPRPAAELLHCVFAGVALDLCLGDDVAVALAVSHMQWDNQVRRGRWYLLIPMAR